MNNEDKYIHSICINNTQHTTLRLGRGEEQ